MKRYIKSSSNENIITYKCSINNPTKDFSSCKEIGMHCGSTLEQAINMRDELSKPDALIYTITIMPGKYLELPDDGKWSSISCMNKLLNENIVSKKEYEQEITKLREFIGLGDKIKESTEIRTYLVNKGYKYIVYDNTGEGPGKSYCLLDPNVIVSVVPLEEQEL